MGVSVSDRKKNESRVGEIMSQTNTLPSTMLLYVALTPQPFSTVHPNITHIHTLYIYKQIYSPGSILPH